MKGVSLVILIVYSLLLNSFTFAKSTDTTQIQIAIIVPEQPQNLSCSFSNQSYDGLAIGTSSMRSCNFNFTELSKEASQIASHPAFIKSQDNNENRIVTLEVTVQ